MALNVLGDTSERRFTSPRSYLPHRCIPFCFSLPSFMQPKKAFLPAKAEHERGSPASGSLRVGVDVVDTKHWSIKDFEFDPRTLDVSTSRKFSSETAENESAGTDAIKQKRCSVPCCVNELQGNYYRKYKICEEHAKSPAITIDGIGVRFCQKCGKFHDLNMFDGFQRSCRHALEMHNKRRRAKHARTTKDKPWRHSKKDKSVSSNSAGLEVSQRRSKSATPSDEVGVKPDFVETGLTQVGLTGKGFAEADLIKNELPLCNMGEFQSEYQSEYAEQTLSLKFHSGTPIDLPQDILVDLQHQFPTSCWHEGSIRAGCTYLSVRMRVKKGAHEDELKVLSESLALNLSKAWRGHSSLSKGMEVQVRGSVTHVSSNGSFFTINSLPEVSVAPHVVQSGVPGEFEVIVNNVDLRGRSVVAFCRQNGKYLTTSIVNNGDDDQGDGNVGPDHDDLDVDDGQQDTLECGECSDSDSRCSSESSRSVSGRNSICSADTVERRYSESLEEPRLLVRVLGLVPGSCEIELMVDNVLSSPSPVLVLPSVESVQESRILFHGREEGFIRDAGLVVRHVCSPETLQPADLPMVEHLAVLTTKFAMERRSTHLVRILQEALPPENACCGLPHEEADEIQDVYAAVEKPPTSELNMAYPNGIIPKSSYEIDTEQMIFEELCTGVSRLGVDDQRHLTEGTGWKNLAYQVLCGLGLVVLATNQVTM